MRSMRRIKENHLGNHAMRVEKNGPSIASLNCLIISFINGLCNTQHNVARLSK